MTGPISNTLLAAFQQARWPSLGPGESFKFACQDECMGRCCHSIKIFLDPWDVECMARYLQISSQQFIQQYCRIDFDHRYCWPYILLREAETGSCSFMLPGGRCSIYPVRSRNCRTYPLARAVRFTFNDHEDHTVEEKYFLLPRQPFCFGFNSLQEWNLHSWLADSGLAEYNEKADLYLSVIQYALEKLNLEQWFSPTLARFFFPIIFLPEVLRQKFGLTGEKPDHQEFYIRRMRALRLLLSDLSASLQHPEGHPEQQALSQTSLMERLRQLLSG